VTKTCTTCGQTKSVTEFYRSELGKYGVASRCKPCARVSARAAMAAWRAANPEQEKAKNAAWYRAHPRARKESGKAWADANREKVRKYSRENQARRRAADRDADRAKAKAWRDANPDKQMAYREARRAREAGAPGGGVTSEQWTEVREASLGICAYCYERKALQMDHVEPLVLGGAHDPSNVVACCSPCNKSKGRTRLVIWMARRAA
jgi:5-methylcytosine-specific restriction endonuclease McrA